MKTAGKAKTFPLLIFILIVALIILGLCKDQIIKSAVIAGAEQQTGTKVTIGSFKFNLFKQQIRIRDFKVLNPPGFPSEAMAYFPEISLDYDLPALLKKTLHVALIVVNLREVSVVRNQKGQLNVDQLKFLHPEGPGFKLDIKNMQIDMMSLTVGRVLYRDLNEPANAPPKVFYVNVKNKTFRQITGVQQFASLILFEAIKTTAIKNAVIYGVASQLGYGSMVTNLVGHLLASDESSMDFALGFDRIFATASAVANSSGTVVSEDKQSGQIKLGAQGADVVIKVTKISGGQVNVTVSARKFFLPQPEIAANILYAIEEKLK